MKFELISLLGEAWKAILANSGWMAWNLFLALVPVAISFWLFHRPRSRSLRWGVFLLLGVTFVLGVRRYNAGHVIKLKQDLYSIYLGMDTSYLVGAIALTLVLMGLDIFLLRLRGTRSLLWWAGFLIFIGFLPNAPYVLTDIIHLYEDIRQNYSVWVTTLVLIPQYLLFMVVGFEAYVLSLIYLGDYLKRHGSEKFIVWVELIVHGLSAIGIYLGRFQRFNSWHIITQPDTLVMSVFNDLTGKRPALVMAVTFVVIAVLYWLMKKITLAVLSGRSRAIASVVTSQSDLPKPQS
ncbi:DUF1361 domain-containing protein [Kamptonema formosum]|uniref:DUF1361 domain-containing protein n=1 Tax=Kamptonema formosum TaxID=331992 RepID=UPI00034A7F1D|nr:DUF1361 domain-containing protein [Oscillatoria sp. PCC 10802]